LICTIAAIAGMRDDLDMRVGFRYALMTSCFFITYVLCQAPMTWLTRAAGPRIVLPGVVFAWGILIIGFGFAKSWTTLVGLRLILGILEAGFFGGGVYLLQTWFTRGELLYANYWSESSSIQGSCQSISQSTTLLALLSRPSRASSPTGLCRWTV
jgi:MFS family permease